MRTFPFSQDILNAINSAGISVNASINSAHYSKLAYGRQLQMPVCRSSSTVSAACGPYSLPAAR